MKNLISSSTIKLVAIVGFSALVVNAHAAVLTASTADAQINSDGTQNNTDYQARIGEFYYPGGASYVAPFLLPTLGAGEEFSTANLRTQLYGLPPVGPAANADLYGLGRRAADTVLASDYYSGTGDGSDATLIQAGFFTDSMALGLKYTDAGGDAALVSYLNAQYAGGAGAGQYVFIRISYAANIPNTKNL